MFSSPGQLFVLHEVDEDEDPEHSLPPRIGPFLDLERVMVPEPHVFEQDPHGPQFVQVQSTESKKQCFGFFNYNS